MLGRASTTALQATTPKTCVRQRGPRSMFSKHSSSSRNRKGLQAYGSMRRKESSIKMGSLPEDGHHSPTETPESWLLAKEHAAANGKPVTARSKRDKQTFKVPYLGLEVTPELVAISMVYFVQGILGLSRLALSFFFKDDLGVEPAQVAVLVGLAGLPWVVKPVYGFISDSIPLFGYRRRSYLMLCGLAGSVSWLSLALWVKSPTAAVAAMLLGSFSTACSDVVVDSLVVERARGESTATAGSLQSLCWASSAVGGIASAYFSGSLVQEYGSNTVFALTAIFPLIVSASALLIDEQRIARTPVAAVSTGDSFGPSMLDSSAESAEEGRIQNIAPSHLLPVKAQQRKQGSALTRISASNIRAQASRILGDNVVRQVGALWSAVKQRHILLPTVFVFLWQATPSADSAMFYFYTNQLHFTPEFLGRVSLAGAVARLAGVALYNGVFKAVPLKRMFLWAMLLGVALGSTQLILVSGANRALGLSDELFVLGDSVVLTALGQVSFMPILVLAARLCPEGVEATLFATLMSILNAGGFTGSALGAGLTSLLGVTSTDFSNLFLLLLLCNLSTLLPAPFLFLLPKEVDEDPPTEGGLGTKSESSSIGSQNVAGKPIAMSDTGSGDVGKQHTIVIDSGSIQQGQQRQRSNSSKAGTNADHGQAPGEGEPLLGQRDSSRW